MAANKQPIFLNSVETPAKQILVATGTTPVVIFTGGADAGAITQLTATSTSTVDAIAVLSVNDGTTTNIIGEVTVSAGSGTNGTLKATTLIDSDKITFFQNDGSILIGPAATFEVNAKVTLTDGILAITAMGGQYLA